MENQTATDMAVERIILWQDFTQPQGYRNTLKLIVYPNNKYCYEFNVGGTVHVIPYNKFWDRLE